jgi:hypothetical protein
MSGIDFSLYWVYAELELVNTKKKLCAFIYVYICISFRSSFYPACLHAPYYIIILYQASNNLKIIINAPYVKGAQAWDIRKRFFYTNQKLMVRWLWDWRKKLKFRKLESLLLGFRREILIKHTISMRLITKKISR